MITHDKETLKRIDKKLPDVMPLRKNTLKLHPDAIASVFGPNSTIPKAAICLQDLTRTLCEARVALHELFAQRIYYLEKCHLSEEQKKPNALFFSRFYADDVALRLYAAGEHLAYAIMYMLEITEAQLNKKKKKKISRQSIVGYFLIKEKPNHPITKAVEKLANSAEWKQAMDYRNKWVHDQPPLIGESGINYKRQNRWKDGILPIRGGGDRADCSIDDLISFVKSALFQFSDVSKDVVQFYIDMLKNHVGGFGRFQITCRDGLIDEFKVFESFSIS